MSVTLLIRGKHYLWGRMPCIKGIMDFWPWVYGLSLALEEMQLVAGVHSISLIAYNLFIIPVTFFSIVYYLAAFGAILRRDEPQEMASSKPDSELPFVSVQIPTYNEPVAIRCAESCLQFDYPRDRFEIIIGDDSSDSNVSGKIDEFAKAAGGMVKVTRRGLNRGFKPGNLNHMLRHSSGEIIVIFDSDFIAKPDFLRHIVEPFMRDEKVACVQAEWDFMNEKTNYVSKMASTLLVFYYSLIVPVNKMLAVPLIFGSGEAVSRKVIEELGGWREGCLTEDTEFSLRVLQKGYRIEFLKDLKVYGEVPYTLRGLISQQKRWAYGNSRAFQDHAKNILFGPLNWGQKFMITYTTYVGYISNFALLAFIISGFIYFFSQPQATIDVAMFIDKTGKSLLLTSGFIFGGVVATIKKGKRDILPKALISMVTVGMVVSAHVCVGFWNSISGKRMCWSAINKEGNMEYSQTPNE
jgi:cellulose synthase/poly-beta-1,6-N-acetylglucosamine synthase-like glycosyltransferase